MKYRQFCVRVEERSFLSPWTKSAVHFCSAAVTTRKNCASWRFRAVPVSLSSVVCGIACNSVLLPKTTSIFWNGVVKIKAKMFSDFLSWLVTVNTVLKIILFSFSFHYDTWNSSFSIKWIKRAWVIKNFQIHKSGCDLFVPFRFCTGCISKEKMIPLSPLVFPHGYRC